MPARGLARAVKSAGTKVRGAPLRAAGSGSRRCSAPPAKVREAMMDHVVVAVGIGMVLVFGTGVMLGIIVMVAAAVRREDRQNTLTGQPPDSGARGVRRLIRLGLRDIAVPDARREHR